MSVSCDGREQQQQRRDIVLRVIEAETEIEMTGEVLVEEEQEGGKDRRCRA